MSFLKFCFRVLVGVFVAGAMTGGSAWGFIAVAVICTGGLGLIVVLPAAYAVGLLCTIWFVPMGSGSRSRAVARKEAAQEEKATAALQEAAQAETAQRSAATTDSWHTRRLASLARYIAASAARGEPWEVTKVNLELNGWTKGMIEHARRTVAGEASG